MSAGVLAGAAAQLLLAGAVGWVAGDFLLRLALGDRGAAGRHAGLRGMPDVGTPERLLAAVVGLVAFAVALMVANLITGGAVFGVPGLVPLCAAALLVRGRRRLPAIRRPSQAAAHWALAGALLAVLFVGPALLGGSGVRNGDPAWHLGWTEQLLSGESVPVGPAPELARNAYPWGWHALMATLVRLVPGSTPLVAHETLHVVVVTAVPLAAACLARRWRPGAGWAAASATAMIGGLGWLLQSDPRYATSPSEAVGGADLVVTSPNALYELFPPALPREMALAPLGAAGALLLARAAAGVSAVPAGVAMGLVGLVNVPMMLTATVWALASAAARAHPGRLRAAAEALAPAVLVFALWAGPVVAGYLRLGGFVGISRLGVEWPVGTAIASWGLLGPLAGAGLALVARGARRSRSSGAGWAAPESMRIGAAMAAVTALLLAAAVARSSFGWTLGGNPTLLHQGRVWPAAHLLGAAFAGVALHCGYAALARRSRPVAAAAAALTLALGAVSPVLASIRTTEVIRFGDDGFVYAGADFGPGSFVRRASAHLDSGDVLEVRGPDELAWALWQLSGARLATYDDPRLEGNDLRIRYAQPAAAWDRRMAAGGFAPDYVVRAAGRACGTVLARGRFDGRRWALCRS